MKVLDCIMEYGLKYSTWDFHILIGDRGLFNSREEHIERYLDKPVESYKITKHDLLIIRLEGERYEGDTSKIFISLLNIHRTTDIQGYFTENHHLLFTILMVQRVCTQEVGALTLMRN